LLSKARVKELEHLPSFLKRLEEKVDHEEIVNRHDSQEHSPEDRVRSLNESVRVLN